jgi:lipopolysaccharide export system permease protein
MATVAMKTLRRYIIREIFYATLLVFVALLLLFAFFDLLEELRKLGQGSYGIKEAALFVVLSAPNHVYELFPIAALIGTLFALSQLVASSEYAVMRSAGVSISDLVGVIASIGLLFGTIAFVTGEFVAPFAEQHAQRLRSQAMTGVVAQEFRSGLWIKDGTTFVNVLTVSPGGLLQGLRIYDFDRRYRLQLLRYVQSAQYLGDQQWQLKGVIQTHFDATNTVVSQIDTMPWTSVLAPGLLNMLLIKPEKMSAWNLYSYGEHLKENNQKSLRYDIALWLKLLYPITIIVMMVLALPFAYAQVRQGGVGAKIFYGIMLGLVFHFLNRLSGHLGLLNNWAPAASAMIPTVLFGGLAWMLLWWQERR